MPTYTHLCHKCHKHFAVRCTIERRDRGHRCPDCGSFNNERVVDAPNFTIKGFNAKNGYSK